MNRRIENNQNESYRLSSPLNESAAGRARVIILHCTPHASQENAALPAFATAEAQSSDSAARNADSPRGSLEAEDY